MEMEITAIVTRLLGEHAQLSEEHRRYITPGMARPGTAESIHERLKSIEAALGDIVALHGKSAVKFGWKGNSVFASVPEVEKADRAVIIYATTNEKAAEHLKHAVDHIREAVWHDDRLVGTSLDICTAPDRDSTVEFIFEKQKPEEKTEERKR